MMPHCPRFVISDFGRETLYNAGLTTRMIEVAATCMNCVTAADMADKLCITESAIKTHLTAIYKKLGLSSRTHLVLFLHPLCHALDGEEGEKRDKNSLPRGWR